MSQPLGRRLSAELLGTAVLVTAVVGSGIAASRLSPHDAGLQLFENAAATAAALVAVTLALGTVSGAHLNPVVTLADRAFGGMTWTEVGTYVLVQVAGAALGAVVANLMFELPAVELSETSRSGMGLWLAEAIATFGLVVVVFGVVRSGRPSTVAFAVGAYVGAAYFFTASTSFANPAVTVAPRSHRYLHRDRLAFGACFRGRPVDRWCRGRGRRSWSLSGHRRGCRSGHGASRERAGRWARGPSRGSQEVTASERSLK